MAGHYTFYCLWATYLSSLSSEVSLVNYKFLVGGSIYHNVIQLWAFAFSIAALSDALPLFPLYEMLKTNSLLLCQYPQHPHSPCQPKQNVILGINLKLIQRSTWIIHKEATCVVVFQIPSIIHFLQLLILSQQLFKLWQDDVWLHRTSTLKLSCV